MARQEGSVARSAAAPGSEAPARRRGVALVATAALLWSSGGLVVRSLETTDSWTIVFWRSATAAAFLVLFVVVREGARAPLAFVRMGWPGLVIALCYALASTSLVIALNLTSVAKVLLIMSSAPFLSALLARLVLGERVPPAGWATTLVCMAGIGVMVSDSYAQGDIRGDLVALLIAVSQAVAVVTMRRHRHVQMMPAMGLATLIAMLAVLPLASPASVSWRDLALLTFFGAGQLGLGLALFSFGAPLVPAAQAALLNVLEPILGPLWVWLGLGERPSDVALLGGGIVLVALAANTLLDLAGRRRAE